MFFKDPKTFDEFLKRAAWGPWVFVAVLSTAALLLFVVAVVFERDPTEQFAPISEKGKLSLAISAGLIFVVGICVAPFFSRSIRILAQRGHRIEGRIASYAPLPKGGSRLVTVEYQAGDRTVTVNRDVPNDDLDELLRTGVELLYDPQKPTRMMLLPPDIARLPRG